MSRSVKKLARHDADAWMAETPMGEWLASVAAGQLGADESLINALGGKKAAAYLGVSQAYDPDGGWSDAARLAFAAYSQAWADRVRECAK